MALTQCFLLSVIITTVIGVPSPSRKGNANTNAMQESPSGCPPCGNGLDARCYYQVLLPHPDTGKMCPYCINLYCNKQIGAKRNPTKTAKRTKKEKKTSVETRSKTTARSTKRKSPSTKKNQKSSSTKVKSSVKSKSRRKKNRRKSKKSSKTSSRKSSRKSSKSNKISTKETKSLKKNSRQSEISKRHRTASQTVSAKIAIPRVHNYKNAQNRALKDVQMAYVKSPSNKVTLNLSPRKHTMQSKITLAQDTSLDAPRKSFASRKVSSYVNSRRKSSYGKKGMRNAKRTFSKSRSLQVKRKISPRRSYNQYNRNRYSLSFAGDRYDENDSHGDDGSSSESNDRDDYDSSGENDSGGASKSNESSDEKSNENSSYGNDSSNENSSQSGGRNSSSNDDDSGNNDDDSYDGDEGNGYYDSR